MTRSISPFQMYQPADATGLITEEHLGHRWLTEPQAASKVATMIHAVNKGITMMSYLEKYSTLYLESDDDFKWALISNGKKNIPLVKASLTPNGTAVSPLDRVGVGGSEFYLTFEEPWFSQVNQIVGERNELYPIRVLEDPRPVGNYWEYRCMLNTGNKDLAIPYEELQAGKRFSRDFSPVERTLSNRGGKANYSFPFEMKNSFTKIRLEQEFAGNMINRPVRFSFMGYTEEGNPVQLETWLAYQSYQFEMQYQDEKAKMIYWSTSNMASDGTYPVKGDSQHILQTGAGIRQQIKSSNDWKFNEFDIDELTNLFLDLSVGKIPISQRSITLNSGEYGMIDFSKSIENYSTLYTPNMTQNRIEGTTKLTYRGQFTRFIGPNGIDFNVMHDALKDDIERNKLRYPGKPGYAESYVFDIMNMYKSDGGANIQKVEVKGQGDVRKFILGLNNPYNTDFISTSIDGWTEHRMYTGGSIVHDATLCAIYGPNV